MARRKSKMFKTISNVHTELVDDDDWSSFCVIDKSQDSMASCYVDKVRISWVASQEEAEANIGFLFVASTDHTLDSSTPGNNDGRVISASASRGAAGVVTLDVRRKVASNLTGTEGLNANPPIYLHIRSAKIGEQSGAYMVIETWGRWHKVTSL